MPEPKVDIRGGSDSLDDGSLASLLINIEEARAALDETGACIEAAKADARELEHWSRHQMVESIAEARYREYYAAEREEREGDELPLLRRDYEETFDSLREMVGTLASGGMPVGRWLRCGEKGYYLEQRQPSKEDAGGYSLYSAPGAIVSGAEDSTPEKALSSINEDLLLIHSLKKAFLFWGVCAVAALPLYAIFWLLPTQPPVLLGMLSGLLFIVSMLAHFVLLIGFPIWAWEEGISKGWGVLKLYRRRRTAPRLREAEWELQSPVYGSLVEKGSADAGG